MGTWKRKNSHPDTQEHRQINHLFNPLPLPRQPVRQRQQFVPNYKEKQTHTRQLKNTNKIQYEDIHCGQKLIQRSEQGIKMSVQKNEKNVPLRSIVSVLEMGKFFYCWFFVLVCFGFWFLTVPILQLVFFCFCFTVGAHITIMVPMLWCTSGDQRSTFRYNSWHLVGSSDYTQAGRLESRWRLPLNHLRPRKSMFLIKSAAWH